MRYPAKLMVALVGLLLLWGCGGGGGGGRGAAENGKAPIIQGAVAFENESNDTIQDATRLPESFPAGGEIGSAGDVDFWCFEAEAGQIFRLTLHATRLDFSFWNNDANVPRLRIFAPDGARLLQAHDVERGWTYGRHDLDFPFIRIKEDGRHYIAVDNQDPTAPGGAYVFEMARLGPVNVQEEAEFEGVVGQNDTADAAQPLSPGTLFGHTRDDDEDWYEIALAATPQASVARLRFVVTCYRNGVPGDASRYGDLKLELYDEDGTTLIARDGDSFFLDPALGIVLPLPRTVYLRVLGSSDRTVPTPYVLEYDLRLVEDQPVELEPNDRSSTGTPVAYGDIVRATQAAIGGDQDYFRFEGQAGDMIRIWLWHGPNTLTSTANIGFQGVFLELTTGPALVPFDRTGQTFDVVRAILPISSAFALRIEPSPNTGGVYFLEFELVSRARFELEDNGSILLANPLDGAGRAAGHINSPGDEDVFQFQATEGEFVSVLVFAKVALSPGSGGFDVFHGFGSDLAPQMSIGMGTGPALAFSDYAIRAQHDASSESIVDGLATIGASFIAPQTGTVFVRLRSKDEKGGFDQVYQLQVRRSLNPR